MIDMSDAFNSETVFAVKRITTTDTIDFVPQPTNQDSEIIVIVQPAQPDKLNKDSIDWNKKYLMFHTKASFNVGDYIVNINSTFGFLWQNRKNPTSDKVTDN